MKRLKETWKDIPEYEGYYQVSNLGRVRSLDRVMLRCNNSLKTLEGKLLLSDLMKGGYLQIQLSKNSERKKFLIHRLVLLTFIGPCPDGMEACHNDGNRINNVIYNLRYDTRKNNIIDRERHGNTAKGESHGLSKLIESDVIEIRESYKEGNISQNELARKYNVSRGSIRYVINRKSWKHIQKTVM